MISRWGDFEHKIWALLKLYGLENSGSYLLAVSGGVDSMAMLDVMVRLRPQALIRVAHFHHGDDSVATQLEYRDQVADFVQHKISEMNARKSTQGLIEYHSEKSSVLLCSEADMRKARWAFLRGLKKNESEPVLTAHHADDWLETSLLKMIRGTSLEGLAGFQIWNGEIFRPFLSLPKKELLQYANQQKIGYLDDPSNKSHDHFRNWVREKWLVDLESKQPGSVAQLSRSLLQIVDEFHQSSTFELNFYQQDPQQGLDRAWFLALSRQDQMKAIALYLKSRRIFEFTRGQLEEIIKRLDKNQKDLTFEIIDRKWVINALQIMLT